MLEIMSIKKLILLFISLVLPLGCRADVESSNKKMEIYLNDGGALRVFHIDSGYLEQESAPATRDYLMLVVGYPDMLPRARSNVSAKNMMLILIDPSTRHTLGETTVATWQKYKDAGNVGSRFERYVGVVDGYEVFESAPNLKTGKIWQTRIFYDRNKNIVSDDGFHGSARMLSGLVVRYGSSVAYGTNPKAMHAWVEEFLEKLSKN